VNRTPDIPADACVIDADSRPAAPRLILALVCAIFSSSCATPQGSNSFQEAFASDDPCSNNARNIGIVGGAILGGIIGNQIKHSDLARTIGIAAGATLGGLIGADIDRRRCELSKIAKANGLDMQVEAISTQETPSMATDGDAQPGTSQGKAESVGLRVAIQDNGRQFKSGSAELSPEAKFYFRQIAGQYAYTQQQRMLKPTATQTERDALNTLKAKKILLVGHTDDTGSSQQNADLSERRARAVAVIFQEQGITTDQLFFQGAGETLPVADNRTDAGRARNRRVEIVDLSDDKAFRAYLASRQPKVAYYRSAADGENGTTNSPSPPEAAPKSAPALISGAAGPKTRSRSVPAPTNDRPSPSSPASNTPAATASQEKVRTAFDTRSTRKNTSATFDFGGQPVSMPLNSVDIGRLSSGKAFSVVSSAYASEIPVGNCTEDRPRIAHGVKSLKDDREYSTSDYLPGVYDSSWAAQVNGHLIALTNVAVLRDGGSPARKPQLMLFRDYNGDTKAKPDHSGTPEINTYQGEKALLYRVFSSGPVRCMDIVIPNDNPREAPRSALFYERANKLYSAAFNPKLAK